MPDTILAWIGFKRFNVPTGLMQGSHLKVNGTLREVWSIRGKPGGILYRIELLFGEANPPRGAYIAEATAVK